MRRGVRFQGFSLVEVLVAMAVLGVASVIVTRALETQARFVKREEVRSKQFEVLTSIIADVDRADRWLPAQTAGTSFDEAPHDSRITKRCYSVEAIQLFTTVSGSSVPLTNFSDPQCHFKVQFFKAMVIDRNYLNAATGLPTNRLGELPMARYFFRVRFTPTGTTSVRDLRFSRIKTGYARY